MKITSRIEKFEGNNVHLKGKVKPFFIPSEDLKPATTNYPIGMVVTIEVDKGTIKRMTPATAAEAASYAQDEKAAEAMKAATPDKKPAGFETGKEILERNLKEKVNEVKKPAEKPVEKPADPAPPAKTAEKQAQIDSVGVSPVPATIPPTTAELEKKPPIITPPGTRVTIAATVNLLNYENIRIEIEGYNVETCKAVLKESLLSLAQNPAYSTTRDLINSYVDRVLED